MNPNNAVYTVNLKLTGTMTDLLLMEISILSHNGTQPDDDEFRSMMTNVLCDTMHVIKTNPFSTLSTEFPETLDF